MKFCLFYAWREMRRRPMRFVSLGCVIGITVVILPMIYGILTVFSGDPTRAVGQFLLLAVLIGGLMTVVIYALCSQLYRQTASEYDILGMYGAEPRQIRMIHTIQILIISIAVIIPSLGITRLWLNHYARKTDVLLTALEHDMIEQCPLWLAESFHFPKITGTCGLPAGFVLCGLAVLVLSLFASRLAVWRQDRTVTADIGFLQRTAAHHSIVNMSSYRRTTFFRMRSSVRRLRVVAAAILFLPLFLFGVSALFSDVTPTSDMTISLEGTEHREIDASVIDAVCAVSGIRSCRCSSCWPVFWPTPAR